MPIAEDINPWTGRLVRIVLPSLLIGSLLLIIGQEFAVQRRRHQREIEFMESRLKSAHESTEYYRRLLELERGISAQCRSEADTVQDRLDAANASIQQLEAEARRRPVDIHLGPQIVQNNLDTGSLRHARPAMRGTAMPNSQEAELRRTITALAGCLHIATKKNEFYAAERAEQSVERRISGKLRPQKDTTDLWRDKVKKEYKSSPLRNQLQPVKADMPAVVQAKEAKRGKKAKIASKARLASFGTGWLRPAKKCQ